MNSCPFVELKAMGSFVVGKYLMQWQLDQVRDSDQS